MITVFTGPMFSGKSARLIEEYNKIYNKENVLVFKPVKDTRVKSKIRTRGIESDVDAISIKDLYDIYRIIEKQNNENNKMIFMDEAQFLTGNTAILLDLSIILNYNIYIAGLNMTSEYKPFGIMPNIMAIADKIEFLEASCYYCNKPARYTNCLVDKTNDILVGSNEYIPVCKNCANRKELIN